LTAQRVLALNCGSSSLKLGVYVSDGQSATAICDAEAEEIKDGHAQAFAQLWGSLQQKAGAVDAVGHRFVHGGPRVRAHCAITPEIVSELRAATAFAPLHMPAALSVLDAVEKEMPGLPQVACLDTAFHRDMPDVAKQFALPREARELGAERYGFHGLSLESILDQLHPIPARIVVAHLGNGSSITAIENGKSIDTTMGLTPTGGVMMGTRCGDLDPGVVTYLMRHGYESADELDELFDRRSGLLGVSGVTSDVRTLMADRRKNGNADLALRMFCYQVRKAIAAMAGALGGIDALVFTGGIGEHAGDLRDEICSGLALLPNVAMSALRTQEDAQIAKITARLATRE